MRFPAYPKVKQTGGRISARWEWSRHARYEKCGIVLDVSHKRLCFCSKYPLECDDIYGGSMSCCFADFLLDTPQNFCLHQEVNGDLSIIDYQGCLNPALIGKNHRCAVPQSSGGMAITTSGEPCAAGLLNASIVVTHQRGGSNAWADTVPQLLRNPLSHVEHLKFFPAIGHTDRLLFPVISDERTATTMRVERKLAELWRPEAGGSIVVEISSPADGEITHRDSSIKPLNSMVEPLILIRANNTLMHTFSPSL